MAVVPLFILLAQLLSTITRDLESRTAAEVNKTLVKMSKEIFNEMGNQKSVANGLAKVPIVKEFSSIQLHGQRTPQYEIKANQLAAFFLNYQSTAPSIQALRFTDLKGETLIKVKEGKLLASSKKTRKGYRIVESIDKKVFFKRALASALQHGNTTSISNYERGKVLGDANFLPAMVRYSVPIRDELDTLQGFLIVNMWGKRIDDTVETALGGIPGNVYVVEINPDDSQRDGIYLYHKNPDRRFSNQLGTDGNFKADVGLSIWQQLKGTKTHGKKITGDGRRLFYRVHSPYKDRRTRWLLIIDIPGQAALSGVKTIRNTIGLLIVLVLVASLFVAKWMASRLARPVQEMAKVMTRYADGDKKLRYQQERSDEIEEVGQAFNYLSEKLEKSEHNRKIAETAARQSERLAAIGQMAAGIGHEINNPLMNINSLVKLIEQSLTDSDLQTKEDFQAVKKEIQRCAGIVQGILNFARESETHYRETDLIPLIRETVSLFSRRLSDVDVSIEMTGCNTISILGDQNQLQQVLVNILLNAIQASPRKGLIEINTTASDDGVIIKILDQGDGIDGSKLSKIFDPFFSTKAEGEGTGLGLSVSYGIVKKHQGNITINNRQEGGVCVEISLPKNSNKSADELIVHKD